MSGGQAKDRLFRYQLISADGIAQTIIGPFIGRAQIRPAYVEINGVRELVHRVYEHESIENQGAPDETWVYVEKKIHIMRPCLAEKDGQRCDYFADHGGSHKTTYYKPASGGEFIHVEWQDKRSEGNAR